MSGVRRWGWSLVLGGVFASSRTHADSSEVSPQVAYAYGEIEPPRSLALGGALHATASGSTSVFLNPATLNNARLYHIEGIFNGAPEVSRKTYGGVISDSQTGRLAGGVAFFGSSVDATGLDRSALDGRVALAYPFGDRLSVGIAGRYARVTQHGLGPFGDSKVSGGLRDSGGKPSPFVNAITVDAGVVLRATDALYMAAFGHGLTHPNHSLLPTTLGGAIGLSSRDLTVEVDGLADLTSFRRTTSRFMGGIEYLAADRFPLRAGYRYEQGADMHWVSGGIGFLGRELGIEASVRRAIEPPATIVAFSLAYFMESSTLGSRTLGEF